MELSELIENWNEKNGVVGNVQMDNDELRELAVNCISLSSAWFANHPNDIGSCEIVTEDKEGEVVDVLCGVTEESVPMILLESITFNKNRLSKVVLNSFKWTNGKKDTKEIGVLEIS